ncbi:coatomer subunit zeta, putative [Trypanosoma equiperdum]|uniref:Coatomer subunit zeta n=4 Tax=Trypanozoon TaxID=39700 RepID=Q38BH3_TRYB2|nr:coatomer subunit zeta [Trypanosoma brucei brucei TREU927]EAN77847.1 coatomer zeta subunit, putative [Trypanosoma brucei brucei TREU927]RHW68979.1 coatomer subunit zeta [Trypanosoma brucei equiperdum]SCU66481.1 coatomer subunit zeta, putative [Trypanosoma equiperdum]
MEYMHHIQGVVVLNDSGNRVFVKYYLNEDMKARGVLTTLEKQRALERVIYDAVSAPKRNWAASKDGDIVLHDVHSILFHVWGSITFAIVGDIKENEMVMHTVLRCIVDALQRILKTQDITHKGILEKYDALVLAVDEVIDDGIVLETSAQNVADDVAPFMADAETDTARSALSKVNEYLKENL